MCTAFTSYYRQNVAHQELSLEMGGGGGGGGFGQCGKLMGVAIQSSQPIHCAVSISCEDLQYFLGASP